MAQKAVRSAIHASPKFIRSDPAIKGLIKARNDYKDSYERLVSAIASLPHLSASTDEATMLVYLHNELGALLPTSRMAIKPVSKTRRHKNRFLGSDPELEVEINSFSKTVKVIEHLSALGLVTVEVGPRHLVQLTELGDAVGFIIWKRQNLEGLQRK